MHNCIYCGASFAKASEEHILQNSLGARWTSGAIVCDTHQTAFGHTIDAELSNQTKILRTLFNHETGRGREPLTIPQVPKVGGGSVALGPGGTIGLNQPEVIITDHHSDPNAKHVEIRVKSQKDIDWALHLLKEKLPNAKLDADTIRKFAKTTQQHLDDTLVIRPPTGGHDYHRATAKAVFNLAGAAGVDLLDRCFDPFRNFVRDRVGDSADFVRFAVAHDSAAPAKLGSFDHFIAVVADGPEVRGYVQLYGGLHYVMQLATNYQGLPFVYGYQVNPLRDSTPAETRAPQFDAAKLPRFEAQPRLANEQTREWMVAKVNEMMAAYFAAARTAQISDIVDEVLGPTEGKHITPAQIQALSAKLAEVAARMMTPLKLPEGIDPPATPDRPA